MADPQARFQITAQDKTAEAWNSALRNSREFSGQIKELLLGVAGLGGLAIGASQFGEALGKAIDQGDAIERLSKRLDTTSEFLSQMRYAAYQADVAFDSLVSGIDTMSKNISMAATGTGRAKDAIKQLYLNAAELNQLPLDKKFEVISSALADVKNATDRTRISMQIFGDPNFLSIFGDDADAIARVREESDKLGNTIDGKVSKSLAEMQTSIKQLKTEWDGLITRAAYGASLFAKDIGFVPLTEAEKTTEAINKLQAERQGLIESSKLFQSGLLPALFGEDSAKQVEMYSAQIGKVTQKISDLMKAQIMLKEQSGASKDEGSFINIVVPELPELDLNLMEKMAKEANEAFANAIPVEETEDRLKQIAHDVQDQMDAIESFAGELSQFQEDQFKELEQRVEADTEVLGKHLTNQTREMKEIAASGARDIQASFSDFLFDPSADGFKGMANNFLNAIKRMIADAAAADIFKKLFGETKDGSSSSGLGSLFSAILTYGGGKASGGPLDPNKWYVAGEHGPEPIWGGGPGAFAMGYGGQSAPITIVNNLQIGANNAVSRAEVVRSMKLASDSAVSRISDMRRRGQL